jgi:hypothetical protein
MHLILSPQRGLPGTHETTVTVAGDTLIVDGVAYDLSQVPEGGRAEPEGEHPFIGAITRQGGVIRATVRVVLGDTAEAYQPADPAHWTIPEAEGEVEISALRRPPPERAGEFTERM